MKHLKVFEKFDDRILLIVDTQKSYRKFFSEMFLHKLKEYCKEFSSVYQIWDNHVDGKKVDHDYLYDENPTIPIHKDLYNFPNQRDIIEKRYRYDVDVDFFKNKMDIDAYRELKDRESKGQIKVGEVHNLKGGIHLIYVGNNHRWFECPKKLWFFLEKIKTREVIIVGGADNECLEDIYILCKSLGIDIKRNWNFIWSANHCPM